MKIVLVVIQGILVLLNFLGVPGNLISLISPILLLILGKLTLGYFLVILGIIFIGEIIEFLSSYLSGKYFGMSKKSIFFSMIFALILSIGMAPIFFGLGAIIGAFLGAFIGTFIYEIFSTKDFSTSIKRSFVSLIGKVTGTSIKIALGLSAVYITYIHG